MAAFTMYVDNPLLVSLNDTFSSVIPDGELLTIDRLEITAQQDDRDEGAVCELFWDILGTGADLRLIHRSYTGMGGVIYLSDIGFMAARDGTKLQGDGSARLLVRRRRISAFSLEFEVVIIGFTR